MVKKRVLLIVVSCLMIPVGLLMTFFLVTQINHLANISHRPGETYAALGAFLAAILYLFSLVTAVFGFVFAARPSAKVCRIFGWVQMSAALLLIVPLLAYAFIFLPPMWLLTLLYLIGARKKRDLVSE